MKREGREESSRWKIGGKGWRKRVEIEGRKDGGEKDGERRWRCRREDGGLAKERRDGEKGH